jgi:hypothetical protein
MCGVAAGMWPCHGGEGQHERARGGINPHHRATMTPTTSPRSLILVVASAGSALPSMWGSARFPLALTRDENMEMESELSDILIR